MANSSVSIPTMIGVAVGGLTIFISVGSLLLSIGKLADQVGQNTESLNFLSSDLKGLPTVLQGITKLQAVTTTKLADNKVMLQQLNTNENMMRGEIQRNYEMKLNRDDFFRLDDERLRMIEALNGRLLYVERQAK